jgi:23S rRNA pseudouridine1911/1915/1917 synthase
MEYASEAPGEPVVVFEDECLVAVRKPPRMHCAPGAGPGDLCAWTFERYPDAALSAAALAALAAAPRRGAGGSPGSVSAEGGLLHRLDYETSGLVLFARSAEAFASLLEQQARGAFRKEYLALCAPSAAEEPRGSRPARGLPSGIDAEAWSGARESLDSGRLAALLGAALGPALGSGGAGSEPASEGASAVASAFRPFGPKGARVACVEPGEGQLYRSELLAASPGPLRAPPEGAPRPVELRLGLARGFRHQLRAHLAWIGLPILGDPLYGGGPDSRLRLYAVRLSFEHPISGNAFAIELG